MYVLKKKKKRKQKQPTKTPKPEDTVNLIVKKAGNRLIQKRKDVSKVDPHFSVDSAT